MKAQKMLQYGGMAGTAACGVLARLNSKSYNKSRIPPSTEYVYTTPPSREKMVGRMKDEVFDVVVIGGGATGTGVVLDAASRGLNCALVERGDFGCGTSSRSTKLIHGGIRYLEAAMWNLDIQQFKLLCEALKERAHLMAAAPYMSRPIPILMPVYKFHEVPMFWAGVKMYDWIGKVLSMFQPGLPNCFWISKSNSCYFFPLLNQNKLKGSIVYYDGQMNDARLNLQLAMTAAVPNYVNGMRGAAVANHCAVTDLRASPPKKNEKGNSKPNEVDVEDSLTGEKFTIKTKTVINCTGPYSDMLRQKGQRGRVKKMLKTSTGVHVALPSYYSSAPFGMIIPETEDGRVLYYLPWENNTIAGTTDTPEEPSTLPKASKKDVDFIVKESCRYLNVDAKHVRSDIRSAWSGLRPLVKDPKYIDQSTGDASTSKLSRTHEIILEKNGCLSVLGGKWTTYRQMAEDAVDKLLAVHGKTLPQTQTARTKHLLLSNAVDPTKRFKAADANSVGGILPVHLVHTFGISIEQARHLVSNYGFRSEEVCELGKSMGLLQPLVEGHFFLRAEVPYAIRHEMARKPSDVLGRRLRLAFVDVKASKAVLDAVLLVMAKELSWSPETAKKMREEGAEFLKSMEGGFQ